MAWVLALGPVSVCSLAVRHVVLTMPTYPNVSPNITHDEFSCHHCKKLPPDFFIFKQMYQDLFDVFEHIRLVMKRGLPVESGYRCVDHNVAVGGAPLSVHLFGLALDINVETKEEGDRLYQIIERDRPDVRMGRYLSKPGLVHIDVGYLITPRATPVWQRGVRWQNK